jgi:hypothetical protein
MSPTTPSSEDHVEAPRHFSRRRNDHTLVRTLAGACVFLFIINVILGTFVFTTTDNVENNQRGLKTTYCLTTSAYRSALIREQKLSHTDPPSQRPAHRRSVEDLKSFLSELDKVGIDCRSEPVIKLKQ